MKGSGVVFTHGEGISTPHVRPKGRQPLIECANMTLIFTFPFYVLISFIPFLYFFFFVVDKGVSLCSYVFLNFGMRKSDLRSSFGTKCLVKLFLSFLQNMFLLNKRSFKVLDH